MYLKKYFPPTILFIFSKLKPGSLATNKNFLARTLHSVKLDRQEWEERKAAAIKQGKRNMAKMDGKTNNK